MQKWLWTLGVAVVFSGLLFTEAAPAQGTPAADDSSVRLTAPQLSSPSVWYAREVDYQDATEVVALRNQPTPAPLPDGVEGPPSNGGEAVPDDPAYDRAPCAGGCARDACRNPACDKPFKLFDSCFLQQRGIAVGGWIQQGITFNAQDPVDRFNGPVATNDRDGDYQMNQLWLYAVRPIDTGGCGLDVGGRVDMIYGSDFRFGINYGLEDQINNIDQAYGLVIPQAYLEVGVNNLSLKLGHFAGILDYEAVPAVANPFYSHSYCYGYTVPQLVTGAMADYKLDQQWSVSAGFHRGWMMFEDINNDLDFMGGLKWESCDKRSSLAYAVSVGPQDPAGAQDRFVYSLVAKHQVTRKLQYVLVHNLGTENNAIAPRDQGPRQDAEWYGINQYFLYTINPCWSAGLRFEWLRDDDGARIFGVPNVMPPVRTWPGQPGFVGNFYELTLGLNWRPRPNVLFRPEVRWDWYDGTQNLGGELPFDDGNRDNQFTFALDMIVTY